MPPTLIEGLTPAQRALAETRALAAAAQLAAVTLTPQQRRLEARYEELCTLVERVLGAESMELAGKYVQLLAEIADDQVYEGVSYLGLIRAPATVRNHHARDGGLIQLALRMWSAWIVLRNGFGEEVYRDDALAFASALHRPPFVTDALVLRTIIHRVIPRGWATYVDATAPGGAWTVERGEHPSEALLAETGKAAHLLGGAGIEIGIELAHALGLRQDGRERSVLCLLCDTLVDVAEALDRIETAAMLQPGRVASAGYLAPGAPTDEVPGDPRLVHIVALAPPGTAERDAYLARWVEDSEAVPMDYDWHEERQRALRLKVPEAERIMPLVSYPGRTVATVAPGAAPEA